VDPFGWLGVAQSV